MPIDGPSIAVRAAVLFFFLIGLLCWLCGVSPVTCSVRSTGAAILVYVACRIAVNLINRILIDALIKSRMKQHEQDNSDRQA